jgi:phosphoribosylamine--glycine ligase
MRVLVVGGGAREHAIARTLSIAGAELVHIAPHTNPGIARLARATARSEITDADAVVTFAERQEIDYAVIGPEAALAAGVTDALRASEISVVGPSASGARIESSKLFCRELLARNGVGGQPRFEAPRSLEEVDALAERFGGPFVVKPSGLTAGKGVWVQGSDFIEAKEGAAYAKSLLVQGQRVLLEEKLVGEEFSLMAFVTDSGIYPMPAVQDFKRALEGDKGGNTGGMGAYSQRDHLLPFLPAADRDAAVEIIRQSVAALRTEGIEYRGILYGGFMLTAQGPKLVEFNARFGDPESINVLSLYEEGNFDELMFGVASGRVDPNLVRFRLRSTVLKYIVPPGYGDKPHAGGILRLDEPAIEAEGVHVYFGSVEEVGPSAMQLGSGRGIALVGEASAIHEAGTRVETALAHVRGEFYVRHDIGTNEDLARRREHMRQILSPGAKPSPLPLSVAPAAAPPSSAASPDRFL